MAGPVTLDLDISALREEDDESAIGRPVSVDLDISALREDDNARLDWLDKGFRSTTEWESSNAAEAVEEDPSTPTRRKTLLMKRSNSTLNNGIGLPRVGSRTSIGAAAGPRMSLGAAAGPRKSVGARRSFAAGSAGLAASWSAEAESAAWESGVERRQECKQCMKVQTFTEYSVPKASWCWECGELVSKGGTLLWCPGCSYELCAPCAAKLRAEAAEQAQRAQLEEAAEQASSAGLALPSPRGAGADNAKAKPRLSTLAPIGEAEALPTAKAPQPGAGLPTADRRASASDGARFERRMTQKTCERCTKVFAGFGSICGSCRKFGPKGTFRQCFSCGQFFQGHTDLCQECCGPLGVAVAGAVAAAGAMVNA